jgi:hypothetical protein
MKVDQARKELAEVKTKIIRSKRVEAELSESTNDERNEKLQQLRNSALQTTQTMMQMLSNQFMTEPPRLKVPKNQ